MDRTRPGVPDSSSRAGTVLRAVALWAAAPWLTGCQATPAKGSDAGPASFQRDWSRDPAVFTLTGATEIDALGDIHGDLDATIRVLSAAGLIAAGSPFQWTGGARVLVVTGDVIDKGSSAMPVIDLFLSLEPEARAAGGAVVVLLGNHEAEFLADPGDSKSSVFQGELQARGLDPGAVADGASPYGAWLLTRPVAALIDGWFFCHAGNGGGASVSTIGLKFRTLFEQPSTSGEGRAGFASNFLTGSDSLLEASAWWKDGPDPRTTVDAVLAALPASHLVFGHDPGDLEFPGDSAGDREKGELAARYEGRLFLIDVGMSYAVDYSEGALLRISRGAPDRATAVDARGGSTAIWN